MAFAFGVSPAAFSQQRAVTRPVQRYGQAQQGRLTSTLPMRPGMPMAGVTPVSHGTWKPGADGRYQWGPFSISPTSPFAPGGSWGKYFNAPPLTPFMPDRPMAPPRGMGESTHQRGYVPPAPEPLQSVTPPAPSVQSQSSPVGPVTGGWTHEDINHPSVFAPLPQRRSLDQIRQDPAVQRQVTNRQLQQQAFTDGLQYATPAPWSGSMQGAVNRDRMYGAAAGSGPYDGSAGMRHFGPLAAPQQHVEQQIPIGTQYAGGSTVRGRADGGTGLVGMRPNPEADRIAALNAQGRNLAYRSSGPPRGGLTPEMEGRRQAAIQRQQAGQDAYRTGRRDRAIQRYGLTHLTPSYATGPIDAQRYGAIGQQNTGTNRDQIGVFNNHVQNATVTDADGNPSLNKDQLIGNTLADIPPDQAWPMLRDAGVTAEDVAAAHNAAKGSYGGIGGDPQKAAQLEALLAQTGAQEQKDIGERLYGVGTSLGNNPQATGAVLGTVLNPGIGAGLGYIASGLPAPYNPFLWKMPQRQGPLSAPPKSVPRRPGAPAYQPNF